MIRQFLISFLLFISACTAGLSQFTMVSSSASWSTVDDSTYTATVSFYGDLTGQSYNATQIADTFLVYSANEQLYRISSIVDPFFSSATLTIIEQGGNWGSPTGQVCIYNPDGRTTIPEAVFGSNGATAQLLSAVGRYNARQIGTGGSSISNAGTLSFTPTIKIPATNTQLAIEQLRDSLNLNIAKVNSTSKFLNALADGYETIQFDTGTIALTQDLLINRKVNIIIPERCTLTLASGSTPSYYFKSPHFTDPSSRYGSAMFMLDSLSDGSTIQFDGVITFSGVSFLTCGACSPASTATKEHGFLLYGSNRSKITGSGEIIAPWEGIAIVDSDDVTIEGISVTGFGVDKNAGVEIEGSRNGIIRNLYIEGGEEGVDFNTAGLGWTLENIRCISCTQATVEVNNSRDIFGSNITGVNCEKTLEIFDYDITEQSATGVGMGIWSSRVWNSSIGDEFFVVDNENLKFNATAIINSTNTFSNSSAQCFHVAGGKNINLDVAARLSGSFSVSNDIYQVVSWNGNTLSNNVDNGRNNFLKLHITADTLAVSDNLIHIDSPGSLLLDITGVAALSPGQNFVNIQRTRPGSSITKVRSYRLNSTGNGTGITAENDEFSVVILENGELTGFNQDLSIGAGSKVPAVLEAVQNNSFGFSAMPYDSLRIGGIDYSGYLNLAATGSNAVNYVMGTPGANYFNLNYKSGTGFRFYDKDGALRMFFPDDDRVVADFGFSGASQKTAIRLPYGATANRPSTSGSGDIRYNSELDRFECYGTSWEQFAYQSDLIVDAGDVDIVDLSGHYATNSVEGALQEIGDNHLTATASLDFSSTTAQSSSDLTITLTGASVGDVVAIGVPTGSVNNNSCFTAWISAADTVNVRFNNYSSGSIDPVIGTFKVTVLKW